MDNRSLMIAARIPVEAQATTLPRLGLPALREAVAAGGNNPVLFQADRKKNALHADLAMYVYAKELCLSGSSVLCVSLPELVSTLYDGYETFRNASMQGTTAYDLTKAGVLVVSSFCDTGPTFLSPMQRYIVASFLLTRMRAGATVILGIDDPSTLEEWWPTQICAYLAKNAARYVIGESKV